jgi:hypothetical protein
MGTPPQHQIWVNLAKARYYEAHLDRDLLGDWALRTAWGGLGSRRGGTYNTGVASYEDGIEQIDAIARRRARRGYEPLERPPEAPAATSQRVTTGLSVESAPGKAPRSPRIGKAPSPRLEAT